MAKNKIYSQVNQYANREEEIRKAKGNPNKNNHAKKKNSNYSGYTSNGAGAYVASKIAEKAGKQERVKLPLWLNVTLIALFASVGVTLILRLAVFKDSLLLNYLSSLLLGITCLVLFYTRRIKHTKKTGAGYAIITVLLTVLGVVYTAMGAMGLLAYCGII